MGARACAVDEVGTSIGSISSTTRCIMSWRGCMGLTRRWRPGGPQRRSDETKEAMRHCDCIGCAARAKLPTPSRSCSKRPARFPSSSLDHGRGTADAEPRGADNSGRFGRHGRTVRADPSCAACLPVHCAVARRDRAFPIDTAGQTCARSDLQRMFLQLQSKK
jgi:hypothetical protein